MIKKQMLQIVIYQSVNLKAFTYLKVRERIAYYIAYL